MVLKKNFEKKNLGKENILEKKKFGKKIFWKKKFFEKKIFFEHLGKKNFLENFSPESGDISSPFPDLFGPLDGIIRYNIQK